MNIHHNPHPNYHAENLFVEAIHQQFPNANYVAKNYSIAEHFLKKYVHRPSLLATLAQDKYLPPAKRASCLEILANCPTWLKVTQNPRFIGFDIVITSDEKTYYIENLILRIRL